MRYGRTLVVTVLIAAFVAAPAAFGKVCHPKKPITCTAAAFSTLNTFSVVPAAPAKPKPAAVTTKAPVKTQQAMLCGPWVKWRCFGSPIGG